MFPSDTPTPPPVIFIDGYQRSTHHSGSENKISVYAHQSNVYQIGTFDKTKSTFVSLSLPEVYTLRTMMANMDTKINDLINNGGRPTAQGTKKPRIMRMLLRSC